MPPTSAESAPDGGIPPTEDVHTHLDKLLKSKEFFRSERLCRFLRFVVDETLEGRESDLKEYSVGVAVFGKDETYNPSIDPIVRVEARRLRTKLKRYYKSEGREDLIVIDLKKGGYVPAFLTREIPEARSVRVPGSRKALPRRDPIEATDSPSVAVLPFSNLSSDPEVELFCDGLTEEILNGLVSIKDLRVAPRTSSFALKGKDYDLRQVTAELGVRQALEGSVRKAGNKVRVSIRLVDIAKSDSIWSGQYDHELLDVLSIQDEITCQVVAAVQRAKGDGVDLSIMRQRTSNLQAYRAYLKGRYYWDRRASGGISEGVAFFKDSIEEDPSFAAAYAGLVECYALLEIYAATPPIEFLADATQAAAKAVELDETSAEAHSARALVALRYEWNGPLAEKHVRRALELNPNYPTARLMLGRYLTACGKHDEAIAEYRKACDLDPLSSLSQGLIGHALYHAGRYEEAADRLRRTLLLDPDLDLAHTWLALVNAKLGRLDQAILGLEHAHRLAGEDSLVGLELGYAYALAGDRKRTAVCQRSLEAMTKRGRNKLGKPANYYLALLHLANGETERALDSLQEAIAARTQNVLTFAVDPALESLRTHPRFTELQSAVLL